MASPQGSHVLHRLREKHGRIFLSETIRPRALIFGMKHHRMDLCQVCSNYTPGAKNGPARGITCYTGLYREKHGKIFLPETIRHRALIFVMKHHLVDHYQVCSNYAPGAKNGRPWGNMFYIGLHREKREKSSCLKP